jgi:hypothetical protein
MINIEPTGDIPVPFDLADEQPKTQSDAIAIAANTANLIHELGGSIDFDPDDGKKVVDLISKSKKKPEHIRDTRTAAALRAVIQENDFQAFADIQQARHFITNRLIDLASCGDPKLEIKALELLGKHSDIGLFTERSEITVHHTSSASLEASIKERVKRLLNADVTDIPQADDLDTVLGIEAESSVVDKEDEEEPYGQGESARDTEEERE